MFSYAALTEPPTVDGIERMNETSFGIHVTVSQDGRYLYYYRLKDGMTNVKQKVKYTNSLTKYY